MGDVKILLVGADDLATLDTKKTLKSFDYSVTYSTGIMEDIITLVHDLRPDLILMDVSEGTDPKDIEDLKEIKKLSIPIIFLTFHSEDVKVQKVSLTEPYRYLIKPYDVKELKYAIELEIYKNTIKNEFKETETYYKAIFEHTGTATVIIEEDTIISLANTEFENLSGYKSEEIEGKKCWTKFVDKDDLERMKEYHRLRRIDPGSAPLGYDFRFIDRRGDVKNIHLDIGMIPGTKKSVASLLDITELIKTEKALKKSEEKYRSVLDNMVEGCQVIGFNWRYLYVNDAVAKHGRFKKEELMGHTMMEMYPGIEDTDLFAVLRRCMKERSSHHFDNKFTYPDGTAGWFELRVHPVSEGIFILSIDITERVKKQEEILFKSALLEEKIKKQQEKLGYLEKD
ncbi:PAS domain S-box protein [Methanobacterium sp.]|uniref:PAS domain S-box protein n=1 Tax=Methanobacterium sp. TaxID=2164 RepID=UPI002AB9DA66|nr:PAS domain S-box protein [Methanobacterium sp.]MDY9922340.1 PAS domain S-box protein [Methanobacterium sp.]